MNCRLITMNSFTNDLDVLVESLIKDFDNPENKYLDSEIKLKFLNGLAELRQKYPQDDFNEAVKEYMADDTGIYSFGMYVDDFNYLNQLNTLDIEQKSASEVQERESKVDSLSTTQERAQKNNLKGQFLNKYFILNSTGRLFFLNNFKNNIVRSLFVDESQSTPRLVDSNEGMNNQIYFYKRNLEKQIVDAINPKIAQNFKLFSSKEKALKYVEEFFIGENSLVSQDLLYKIPLLNQNNALSKRDITLLNGWQAYVILKNFDPLMKLIFNKAIRIKNMNQYDLDESDKYSLNLGNNNTTTWRDDNKDTDETEEIGSLPILFIESLKVYNENGEPTNQNMTFSDTKVAIGKIMQLFNQQNTSISNKIFDSRITSILSEELKSIYGLQQATDLLRQFVEGKNFKQVLASAKENPAELMPIVFRLMLPIINKDQNNIDINPLNGIFPRKGTKTKETIQSLYYNIYAPTYNSLLSMSTSNQGINPNSVTMYDFINTLILNIENKPMIEYENDYNEGIKIKSLSEKNANSRLSSITRALDGKFNKYNILGRYLDEKSTQFNNFILEDNLNDNRGINIIIGDYTIGVNSNLEIGIYKNNQQEKNINIEDFLPFISEVLDIPLVQRNEFNNTLDNKLYNSYRNLGGQDMDLIRLVSHILYNYQVGKHLQNSKESTYNTDASKFYMQNPPKPMYHQFQPSLIPSFDFNTIKTISQARDIIEGYAEVNTVKDGAGKQISTLALSSLLSKVGEIWENHTKSEDSPSKDFSIFSMFEGFELIRDFSGMGENKQGKSFTQAELAIASIIYDMYGDLEEIEENGKSTPKANGILRVMGPVISDKSNLPKLKFKWDAVLPGKYWKEPNKPLKLRDLTNEDLKNIIYIEFGQYYNNVYNNIVNQYNIINKYVPEAARNLGLEGFTNFDYKTNFQEANKQFGNNTYAVLHEAIYLAQLAGENPEIIDQVGYINNKGQLTNNPSIIHQMKLFGVADSSFITEIPTDETYEQFWNRKEIQLITDFLQSGTILKVKNGETQRKGQAIATAVKYNKDFIYKENIAIAKIINGDKSIKISQINDFLEWYPYRRFLRESGSNNPIYNINDPSFDIQATLNAINRYSISWELKKPENIQKVAEQIKINKRASLNEILNEAKRQFAISSKQNLEEIEESWNNKVKKDFTINGKIDKNALINFIQTQIAIEGINSYFDEDPNVQFVADELGVSDIIEKINIQPEDNYKLEINPEIIKHNLLDFFLGEEFIMATTGTYVSHPAKEENIRQRESTQFGQAIKRYVSYTASKHRETAGNLNGIKNILNIAIIDDYRDSGLNYSGNYSNSSIKPFDGASFYNITMNYLDNNSLGGDAMGVDKKPFAHHLGEKSGIGFILKTAGFALTNDRIRNSEKFYENLNKQMLNIPWSQQIDWTKDFNNKDINYGTWYVYNPNTNKWYARWNPRIENGETVFNQAEVADNGEILNDKIQENIHLTETINTNWKLWNFFGGMYSGHINSDGVLTYHQDNTSTEMLVKAMNNVGVRKYDIVPGQNEQNKVLGQNGVDQILKKAQIDIVATAGAVKYGGANINSNEAYFNPDYHLTYMQINSYDIGEQLDAEHSAEDGNVSLMTQVVNALGARGYSREQAQECYEALEVIAETINKDGLEGLEQLNTSGNSQLLKNSLAQIIYKTLSRVSSDDGNMLNALASTLLEVGNSKFDWSNIEGVFPISHPAIFQKIISSISSELEKGIRLKFEGNMFVLNPSNRIFTTINGKLTGYYKNHMDELLALEEQNKANPIHSYEIKVGFNYRSLQTGELIQVDNPDQYYDMKQRMSNGESFYETVIEEGQPLGHDLATYNAIFADIDGNYYSMWDLVSTQELWRLHESNDEQSKILFRRQLQQDLNAIAEGLESTVTIIKNGEPKVIRIDKSKTLVSPYEIILPKMYKEEFGLKVHDNLSTIRDDNRFFMKRSIENWKSKIEDSSLFDLELKVLNGNHIYLGFPPEEIDVDLTKVNIETEIDGDTMYRITPEGRRLYSIPYTIDSEGKYIPNIEVYQTFDGQEIIYSDNISYFLDEFSYNDLLISNNPNSNKKLLFEAINNSSNKTCKRKLDFLTRIANKQYQKQLRGFSAISEVIMSTNLAESELANLLTEEINITFDDVLENDLLFDYIINFTNNDISHTNDLIRNFEQDLNNRELSLQEIERRNLRFRNMIQSGLEVHTSFLQSLEMIVSRTPAQSQQSFMTQEVAAFAEEDTNSAYVSRMQFLLQGSDLDIDKISLLGLIFNFGKLQTWSPYFNLSSNSTFNASKKLPFPTGNILKVVQQAEKRPFEVIRNDLTVTTGNFDETIIETQKGNYLSVFGTDNKFTINCSINFNSIPPLEQYLLLRRAEQQIPKDSQVNYNFFISDQTLQSLGIINGIVTKNYDINQDFDDFNNSVYFGESYINPKHIKDNIIELSPNLDVLIRTYNKLGYIPETANPNIKEIVDYHNNFLKGKSRKDAAQNFISIRTRDISKSPINQIQAQAAIDEQTDKVKALLNKPEFQRLVSQTQKADRGSVFSKFFMLTLTLAGKENVGIVASSLKNFEGISQYVYQILDEGSLEDQEDLLFNRTINGHNVKMIANSYARNQDTIKSEKVLNALQEVDNDSDAFLVMSALLSLATDNTKDPILPKLNAGPEMLSLYNSGVILGLSVEEVARLVLSDTGILLSELTKSNVFNGKRGFNRLTQAIQYLQRPPSVYFTKDQYSSMDPIFRRLGLLEEDQVFNKTSLDNILKNNYNRITIKRILRFLASPNIESSLLEFNKKLFANTQIAQLRNSHDYRAFSKRREELLNKLIEKKNNLNPEETLSEEDSELIDKLSSYRNNKMDIEEQIQQLIDYRDQDIIPTNENIINALSKYQESSKEDFTNDLKNIRSNLFGNSNSNFTQNINEIINWINSQEVIENDLILGEDERNHRILNQIARLDEFSQELSALRPLLALNQGLPNTLVDQLNFESNFGNIIQNRLNVIGRNNLERFYNVGELLNNLKTLNDKYREQGLIINQGDYYVDLNMFESNPEYNKLVKDIYGKIKFAVNIFKVVDGVSHYKSYLRLANLNIQEGKQSVVYRAARMIENTVVPSMNARSSAHREAIRNNILPAIYRRLNMEFLRKQNITYNIPDFDIIDGKILEKSEGKLLSVSLGSKEANEKFKQWIQYIEFPKWQVKYPDNKFIQALGYRTYDYNENHNQSINLAKIKQFNMKNPSDLVLFDLIKADLQKLPSPVIDKLFFYNIIAYNNQPGQLSLTGMFEDLISANNFESIRQYNTFISNHENNDISITETEKLKQEIAPVLSEYEIRPSLSIPYIYVRNREDGITYLYYKSVEENSPVPEDQEIDDFFGNTENMEGDKLSLANYYKLGETPDIEQYQEVLVIDDNIFISNSDNVKDIKVEYQGKQYSSKEILAKAKQKGFTKLSEIFPKKRKKYDIISIKGNLNTIFNDKC